MNIKIYKLILYKKFTKKLTLYMTFVLKLIIIDFTYIFNYIIV